MSFPMDTKGVIAEVVGKLPGRSGTQRAFEFVQGNTTNNGKFEEFES